MVITTLSKYYHQQFVLCIFTHLLCFSPLRKLTIKNATKSDSGDYSCKVEDQVVTTKLNVLGDGEGIKHTLNLNRMLANLLIICPS